MTRPRDTEPRDAAARRLTADRSAPRPEFAAELRRHLERLDAAPAPSVAAAASYVVLGATLLALPAGGVLGSGPFAV